MFYHRFISYYLTSHRTEFDLAEWLESHSVAVAVQATLGISVPLLIACVSYEYFEKRFLRLTRILKAAM
jgi:hypothetical protein